MHHVRVAHRRINWFRQLRRIVQIQLQKWIQVHQS